ncbi:1-aminocyclopropane-1-carboxylate deaminase/D-cysteine desulfhydrase [Acinetobacter sp. ANC 4648]|uniref:1-aminocyclopropane-1-carboxylate deaminase/D-cysteine desulfhydrase n=1 Tax=Acinetobacter sp. ANC 4648 TaxID=1977875 RepID=UPI000A344B4E|nr:pyridoxal-phosphate dependent enzyme [Acinetobacter sp. ANC 4648]OTG83858.1 1-aminocyclopropane-1-carboxylate deaminase [Acinetobacter sp. ANC 4648]
MFDSIAHTIPDQKLKLNSPIELTIKRLDLVHPQISGNKFFKLKYNLLEAQKLGLKKIITFGGAYSNHIAATAFAAQQFGFESIGIIRGEELVDKPLNHTLLTAQKFSMQLNFISREQYRQKDQTEFLTELNQRFPNSYIIPEGGSNALAIQGCTEILTAADRQNYDVICCAVGTGGTISGLIQASSAHQSVLGFSALKGDFLQAEVEKNTINKNWKILDDYCFGGYAKIQPELLHFIQNFETSYKIPLEHIYTAKMLYGIFDLIQKNYFPAHSRILVIHSGGLQGRISLGE